MLDVDNDYNDYSALIIIIFYCKNYQSPLFKTSNHNEYENYVIYQNDIDYSTTI